MSASLQTDRSDAKESRPPLFVGLGELIWDLLPEGKRLGGAPSNFAYIARLLGNRCAIASRVGSDELGREAQARLTRAGVSADYLQVDLVHPTGTVSVEIGERGEPYFHPNEDSAWDYLELTSAWKELSARADVICFGTLGQRNERARQTIIRFLELSRPEAVRLFDVNLRHSFFTPEMFSRSLTAATVVKLNEGELNIAAQLLFMNPSDQLGLCRQLITHYGLELVAITKGSQGSVLVSKSEVIEHRGLCVHVADTIGCGDAFAAALAHFFVRRSSLDEISHAANRLGAWIATCDGATPDVDAATVERILM